MPWNDREKAGWPPPWSSKSWTGGPWTVSGGQVSGQPNAWGFDAVGWLSSAVTYYYGTHTGQGIGSTTSSTGGFLLAASRQTTCPNQYFGNSGGDNVTPSVTFGDTPLVPMGKLVSTTATVTPTNNTTSITLTISVTSGKGAVNFSNGLTTMTITTTTSVTLIGVTVSTTPNNMQLTATVAGSTVGSMTFTVTGSINGAIPINFRQTSASILNGVVLEFHYTWDSSSGNKADLSTCNIEEFVTYPGYVAGQQGFYYWSSPPYAAGSNSQNPDTGLTPAPASGAELQDDHGHQNFQSPYAYDTVTSNQIYQFQCPYYRNNQWTQYFPQLGTIPITRTVNLTNGSTPWTYQITKSSMAASMNLP